MLIRLGQRKFVDTLYFRFYFLSQKVPHKKSVLAQQRLAPDSSKNASSFRSAWGYAASNAGKYQGESFSPYFIKSKYTLPLAWRYMGNRQNCYNCTGPSQSLSAFWGTGVR